MTKKQTSEGDPARRLAGMFAEFDRHSRALAQRATLGTADMRMLWLLADGEARTLRQIAHDLNLEQSTVNRQVNGAVASGIIGRAREGMSGPYLFTATAQGRREFERNLNASQAAYRQALASLGDDAPRFLELMRQFVDTYRHAVEGAEDASTGTTKPW